MRVRVRRIPHRPSKGPWRDMAASEKDRGAPTERGTEAESDLSDVVADAADRLGQLLGREPDGVTGVRREEDGWSVLVDVVELERIPASASVMATYRVDLDGDGGLAGYERLRRYNRGATDLP
jgi:hypothetical protein